ncbi:hypothetical protein OLMES_5328 [Oleiphilus messinensis]|uniref:Uncharacterized protein n=1 Tax=Oleiphilus messinensis TaxID=141451 RepID=A0A1Y0IFM3_9GAMM|nr:hypothetical protein OLMES_5328 [Oleiphilus messinensis]
MVGKLRYKQLGQAWPSCDQGQPLSFSKFYTFNHLEGEFTNNSPIEFSVLRVNFLMAYGECLFPVRKNNLATN